MTPLKKKSSKALYPSPFDRFSKIDHSSPIVHHLEEVKARALYLLVSILLTFIGSYYFSEELGYLLAKPFLELQENSNDALFRNTSTRTSSFIYTDMREVFLSYLKISLYISITFLVPTCFYHAWSFFSPGLYKFEKRKWAIYFFNSFFLFVGGCSFAYLILLPWVYDFFLSFEVTNPSGHEFLNIYLQPKIQEYFFLAINLIIFTGLFSQLPILLWILLSTELLPENVNSWILQKRNIAYLITFFLAAWVSPPDITSQLLIAFPWILIYELTIFLILWKKQYLKFK